MSASSSLLHKKLTELETELADVYSRPMDPTADDPRRQMPFDDIKQRFGFLRKLLAAEIESQPETSDELDEINRKLNDMEAEFDGWNESKTCIFDNPIDSLEICRDCTHAILNNGGGDDGGDVVGSESEAVMYLSGGQTAEKLLKMDVRERGERRRRKRGKGFGLLKKEKRERGERKRRKKGEYWEAFGSGVIIGALIFWFMMIKFNAAGAGPFLLPPPT